jgi:hypothetical protein
MKKYTIKKERFLEWYFESGQDQENEEIREELAKKLIAGLMKDNEFKITTEDIFKECNQEAIRVSFIDGFEDDEEAYDTEFSELGENVELILID